MTIQNAEIITTLKILLSAFCGGLIGLEYKIKGHFAGLKTFSLVCMGAAIAMVTNEHICSLLPAGTGDLTKMASQVISGIGFLGAGTIIVTNHNQVIGLSTAAALWVTAIIGASIGSGCYFCAFCGVGMLPLSSLFYRIFDRKIMKYSRILCIYVVLNDKSFMTKLIDYLYKNEIRILSISKETSGSWSEIIYCAMIELQLNKHFAHEQLLNDLRKIEGVQYVEEETI